LVVFGTPYALKFFDNINAPIIVANEDNEITQSLSAQLIFGGIKASGQLPVTASSNFQYKNGEKTIAQSRLKYAIPEEVGIAARQLNKIDSIANDAIEKRAAPGCQILVAKEGKVIYEKSFGYHTYDKKRPVKNSDIYDLASVTKIAATMQVLMQLYDLNQLDVEKPLSDYLPDLDGTNKRRLTIKQILVHQAGFKSWIPFWMATVNEDGTYKEMYSSLKTDRYSVRLADNLYIDPAHNDVIWETILESKVKRWGKKYLYSDLGFYMFKRMIEGMIRSELETYVHETFYAPLGMNSTGYHPRERFALKRIVPTENDKLFRKQLIHGDVHDPGAGMLGGVCGHAGLFSNAGDLAKLAQMMLNDGEYGGERFLKEGTMAEFTKTQMEDNRRGLGFDKPEPDPEVNGPTCKSASLKTYGHSGFTGTCMWIDPEHELIYIFLSNRIHPDASNKKLIKMDVRTNIQQVIYDAIRDSNKTVSGNQYINRLLITDY